MMMEQVEANVASLMARKIPPIFGELTPTMAAVAYPVFQEELPGLPSKVLLEHTIAESVQVACLNSLYFIWGLLPVG